jgi:hypothetical protein
MDPYLVLVAFILFSPFLGAALVFAAPFLASFLARGEGQPPPGGAAALTALLPPAAAFVCAAIVGMTVFRGEDMSLALGPSASASAQVTRGALALTLGACVAAAVLNYVLLVRRRSAAAPLECALLLLAEGQAVNAVLIPKLRLALALGAGVAALLWIWRSRRRTGRRPAG